MMVSLAIMMNEIQILTNPGGVVSHGSLTVPPTKPLVDFMTGPATRVVLMSKKNAY